MTSPSPVPVVPGHADYLDSALAAWMSKQIDGGKPVVLRRKL
jgi:hypothetical protein